MRKNVELDERVLAQKRKIGSDACQLLMFFLMLSVLVQQFIFNAPFSAYVVEFIGFFGISIYIVIRTILSGNELYEGKRNNINGRLIQSIISGITITVVVFITNPPSVFPLTNETFVECITTIFIAFGISTSVTFILSSGLAWINKKRIMSIEKELEDENQ